MSTKPLGDDEDTRAILTRRALLIRASLAGAGLVVGTGAGCEQAQACLSQACLKDAGTTDGPEVCLLPDVGVCLGDVQVCLTQDVQVCLEDIPAIYPDVPDVIDGPEVCLSPDVIDGPEVCLSPPLDIIEDVQACLQDVSQPCLSIAIPDVQDTSDDEGPQICLKIAPDVNDQDGPQICLSPPAPDVQG